MWLNYCVSCSLEFTQWNQAKRMHNAGKWKHRFFCFMRVELHQPSTWKAGTSSGQKKRPCNADTVPAMLSPSHLYNCHRSVTWDVVWLIYFGLFFTSETIPTSELPNPVAMALRRQSPGHGCWR
jgi:hypothetical protein